MTFTTFIKRPVLSTVISILTVLLGFIGLVSLPIEQYPNIAPPTVAIWTSYPGADAETVKNSVITPLEESINGVEGMDYITSTASTGSAQISVLFRQGANPDMCAVNVQNRVSQAAALLPAEVNQIGVTVTKRQTSQVIMYTITSDRSPKVPGAASMFCSASTPAMSLGIRLCCCMTSGFSQIRME